MNLLHATGISTERKQLGPYEIESLIPRHEEGCLTAYRVRIQPHSTTSTSYHLKAEELYYVLSGQGLALLDHVPHELKAGDFLRLPPGTRHSFVTQAEELVMLDIHSPGSRPDRDVYFEGEVPAGFAAPTAQADAD
jgi:mannose-6-phosphate isomerase-like protein (cupin superfamily)